YHTYAAPGVYQAALIATSRAGLPMYGRVVVVARDVNGNVGPSLLVTASTEDASLLTPVTVTAYVQGAPTTTMLPAAEEQWPDLVDASPTVTPTMAGISVTSQHSLGTAGYYQIPVLVQLTAGQAPLAASAPLTVGNIDDSPPSPVVLMDPTPIATVGVAY